MAAGLGQLDSFLGKFVTLWRAGLDASLQVHAQGGAAGGFLHVGLGEAPPPHHHQPPRHHCVPGPSHIRRRKRRALARRVVEERRAKIECEYEAIVEDVNKEMAEDATALNEAEKVPKQTEDTAEISAHSAALGDVANQVDEIII